MFEPLVIAMVVVLLVADATSAGDAPRAAAALGAGAGLPVAIATLAHLRLLVLRRRIERTGRVRWVRAADRTLAYTSVALALSYAAAVLVFGWLSVVRDRIGDLVLVDEAITMAPGLLALVSAWASHAPVECWVREASMLRSLDEGEDLFPPPTTLAHVVDRVRHRLLLALIPIGMIVAWAECVHLAGERWGGALGLDNDALLATTAGAQFVGVLLTLALTPPIMRRVWSTTRLGEGPLRDSLVDLCKRHRVRFREILVWRTHGSMLNGAVMGLFGPLRYVLLTDAILSRLPQEQLEAVMAHEVGHVRRRHMGWMMLALIATIGFVTLAAEYLSAGARAAMRVMQTPVHDESWAPEAAALTLAALAGLWAFGVVSRRFERQADAFAVQHLSGMTRDSRPSGLAATPGAVAAMDGALETVARLNHIPREKFMWRHGSIGQRQRALRSLIDTPLHRFPIDRAVRRTKIATLAALALLVALAALDAQQENRREQSSPPAQVIVSR